MAHSNRNTYPSTFTTLIDEPIHTRHSRFISSTPLTAGLLDRPHVSVSPSLFHD